MDASFVKSTAIIKEHRDLLDAIAKTLLEKETIEGAAFLTLLGEAPAIAEKSPIVEE